MHQLLGKSIAEVRGVHGEVGMMLKNQSAVLGRHGSRTPLLLSKELMRRLGVVLDMKDDSCVFGVFNEKVKLCETKRGHYRIPLFKGFGQLKIHKHSKILELSQECLLATGENKTTRRATA